MLCCSSSGHAANTKNGSRAFSNNNPFNYLFSAFNQSFPSIKLKFISPKEIEAVTLLTLTLLMWRIW